MSYPRLVLDRHDAETAHEFLLKVIPFVIECGAAEREYRSRRINDFAVGEFFNKSFVAGFFDQFGHPVHRALERPHFPIGRARRAV